jgi:hypothetical protein
LIAAVLLLAVFTTQQITAVPSNDEMLIGRVQDRSGRAIGAALVSVRFSKADGLCACKWPSQTLRTVTNGTFALRVPPLGFYEVCATAPKLHMRCETVQVSKGKESRVMLTLK